MSFPSSNKTLSARADESAVTLRSARSLTSCQRPRATANSLASPRRNKTSSSLKIAAGDSDPPPQPRRSRTFFPVYVELLAISCRRVWLPGNGIRLTAGLYLVTLLISCFTL